MKPNAYDEMYKNELKHGWYIGTRQLMISFLKDHLKDNSQILDAGCGTGGTILSLKKFGFKNVIGIDKSPLSINYCKKRGIQQVMIGDVNRLKFKSGQFDAVICLDVIYHKGVDPKKAFSEFYRVLRKGGILYVQEPAYNWLKSKHDNAIDTRIRFTKYDLYKLLESQNFEVAKLSYANSLLFLPQMIIRLYRKKYKAKDNTTDVSPLPVYVNKLLISAFIFERKYLRFFNFPFGLSIIGIAKK